ncbi:MAG TPA: PHP domain-containing protein [Gammaproteobacteria bacterium]|nr:PHP domain-containing protein [Gammaproteobacteria bacterium]
MIDLHLHSRASDGALTPTKLVALAAGCSVRTLALTDHDCTDGLAEASKAAEANGIRFIPGVEISVTWQNRTLHIVGLGIKADTPVLQEGLAGLQTLRDERAQEIGRRLAKRGIDDAYAGARELAGRAEITRTHFARHLLARGHAHTFQDAFKRFLRHGKPGHVQVTWASLEQSINWIHASGGHAVFAHPLRYGMTRSWLVRALAAFKEAGGDGMEVICGRSNRDELMNAAHLAVRFGLAGSVGSDFHTPDNPHLQPGGLPALPDSVTPIWDRFESR